MVGISDSKIYPLKYVADGFFTFHHANAYEQEECVVVDLVAYLDGSVLEALSVDNLLRDTVLKSQRGSLWRFILPLSIPSVT